jgi:hypothetical protein
MLKLRDLLRLPDPFQEACRLADSPGGLLGKFPPELLRRVETYIGTPQEKWTIEEWKDAAEILGYFADELERRQQETDEARRLAAAPKKRGPKPKQGLIPLKGLLYVGRARGRPRKLSEAEECRSLDLFERWKATEGRRLGRKLTDKVAANVVWWAILEDQERGKPLSVAKRRAEASRKARAFTKDVSRWRKKYGVPLRTRKVTRPK